ncbi:TRAP transporter small permease [Xanthobacter autotrophicus DSM 431]|uniref:TRAP transporter small permease n=1 Tax=Xanthobacter nonsaccharivorans TaxID=3119912 RepID=UPI00372B889A
MSHGLDLGSHATGTRAEHAGHPLLRAAEATLDVLNRIILVLASLALVSASLILSYSVVIRFFFRAPTYWQDEASVFLLVGATFMTAAYVQSRRGHVAIDALAHMLSPAANRVRQLIVDVASCAFCAFFTWKSVTLLHEAWVDGQVTSSTWGPPLWIPYALMSLGMGLLSLQILVQVLVALSGGKRS